MVVSAEHDVNLQAENDTLRAEVVHLRARIEQLQCQVAGGSSGTPAGPEGEEHANALSKLVLESLPVAVTVYRSDGHVLAANRERGALWGSGGVGSSEGLLQEPSAEESGRTMAFERATRGEVVRVPDIRIAGYGEESGEAGERWAELIYLPFEGGPGGRCVLEVGVDVTERHRSEADLRDRESLYSSIISNSPLIIYAKDKSCRYILANSLCLELVKMTSEQFLGKTDADFLSADVADVFNSHDRDVMTTGVGRSQEDRYPGTDGDQYFLTSKYPIRDARGQMRGICGVSMDITSIKRTEQEYRRLQGEVIQMQEESLRALSTPLLPIAKGVVIMPLIGNVDKARAQRVLETLLEGIVSYSATSVILDVTGMPVIDTEVASALVRTAQAVKLLGASVILTGIQPRIAQTLVTMGADLNDIVTEGTLEGGIARALRQSAP